MTADSQADPYRILVVCTGNICRSPFAEGLLRDAFARIATATADRGWIDAVVVSSAGTHAMVGYDIDPTMAEYFEPHGAIAFSHAARQLDRDLIAESDLVLALTRDHRRDIVRELPSASRRIVALGEFVRLLEDANAARAVEMPDAASARDVMAAIVQAAVSRRGFAPAPDDPADDDVIDPYRRDATIYMGAATRIAELVTRIEAAILADLRGAA